MGGERFPISGGVAADGATVRALSKTVVAVARLDSRAGLGVRVASEIRALETGSEPHARPAA